MDPNALDIVLIDKFDKRKTERVHFSKHHPYTFGIYKFRKSSAPTAKPTIIIEFSRLNRKSESFNRMTISADSPDVIFEAYTFLTDAIETAPNVAWGFIDEIVDDLNSPEIEPELQKLLDLAEEGEEFDLGGEYEVEELIEALKSGKLNLEDIFAKPDMDENDRFTADFMHFCHINDGNFFRLTRIAPYVALCQAPEEKFLKDFDFMAYLSFCTEYDDARSTEEDAYPVLHKMAAVLQATKNIVGEYVPDQHNPIVIQAVMSGLKGYRNKKWTEQDFEDFDGFAEELTARDVEGKLILNDNADRLSELRDSHPELLASFLSECIGVVYSSDIWKFVQETGRSEKALEQIFGKRSERDTCQQFIDFCKAYGLRSKIEFINK